MSDWYAILCPFLNSFFTETRYTERSKFQVHFPLAEWHHNSLLIEMGLAGVTSRGQRVAFLVAIEGVQTDREAEGMEDFVLHRWQQYLEFLWFCADTLWTQVGVSCYRSADRHRPHNIVQIQHRNLSRSDRRYTQTRSQKLRRQTAVTSQKHKNSTRLIYCTLLTVTHSHII